MIMGLYMRLSKEDDEAMDESNSITNQRYILRRYIERMPELSHYQLAEYIDDGYSGKNFERPGIERLLEDVKSGKIYGIVVKDFSRFGRNHIEVGNYIEKIFPLLDIRFIAVNNHFDSADYLGTTPDMDVAFENLMYDYFSEENSIKIKNDLFHKRMRGKYMATFAPYGYKKSQKDHNKILIDEEAADVVKLIFNIYEECGVKAEVARYLNERCIPTPQEYAKKKGIAKHWKYEQGKKFWNGSIIGRILKNPIYIGNTVFHKKEVVEVGSKRTRCLPQDEWKTCENTHEGIIQRKQFEWVNCEEFKASNRAVRNKIGNNSAITDEKTKGYDSVVYCEGEKRKRGDKDSPIKGIVKCGGCRHNMTRRNRRNASYYCRHYYEIKAPECCSENVKEIELMQIVREAISRQAALFADRKELSKLYRDSAKQQKEQMEKEQEFLRNKIQKCKNENFSLYEQYKNEEIDSYKFQEQRQKNLKMIEVYQQQLGQYSEDNVETSLDRSDILFLLEGKENLSELTKEIVDQLVSAIYVYGNGRVEVVFKFKDELDSFLESTNNFTVQKNI